MGRRNRSTNSFGRGASPIRSRSSSSTARKPSSLQQSAQPIIQPAQTSGFSGLFTNFITTAAGVTVGNALGRAIVGMFSGNSSQPVEQHSYNNNNNNGIEGTSNSFRSETESFGCQADSKAFVDCMNSNGNDLTICQAYLDILQKCQASQPSSFH